MMLHKKSIKFLALLLALMLALPAATPVFAWRCPPHPRYYHRCCPPPPPPCHYHHRGYYRHSPAAWGVAGFTTGVVVGTIITTNKPSPEQRSSVTVTETVTLPLIQHKF